MPTVLVIGGNRFFFFSNEGREPPHIHVEHGERYAKFWLDPIALAENYGYNSHELRQLRLAILENYEHLLSRWHDYFGA